MCYIGLKFADMESFIHQLYNTKIYLLSWKWFM